VLTAQEALVAIATATAGAAAEALRGFAPDDVGLGPVSVALPGRDPLEGAELPAVCVSVAYGESGSALFVLPVGAALRLAGADDGVSEVSDAELDAIAPVARAVMVAAAEATGTALELSLSVEDVDIRVAATPREVKVGFQGATRATIAVVSVFGEACRLVQLMPSDVVMRIAADGAGAGHGSAAMREALGATLREVPLRVWAEVGRARLRSAEVASLGDGAIVELDRAAEDPVDLYVNGSRIGTGRLVCIDGKEWAVRLEEVFASAEADPSA
jgi:flagellar motor switch protein FliN/FliY